MEHLFEFTLKPIEECVLQGSDTKNIWWFWITDSWYTIHLGETRLFESSPEWQEKYPGKILESVKNKNELPESYWKSVRQALKKSGLL